MSDEWLWNWGIWLPMPLWRRLHQRPCRAGRHDVRGPDLTMGGWYVYSCTRCSYRWRADRTLVRADNGYSVNLESE